METKYTVRLLILWPCSFGPPMTIRLRFSMVDWANKPEVQQAWKELAQEHGLRDQQLRDVDRIFTFADAALANVSRINMR